jgi:hypothetical protein
VTELARYGSPYPMDEASFLELVRQDGFAVQPLAAGAPNRSPGSG